MQKVLIQYIENLTNKLETRMNYSLEFRKIHPKSVKFVVEKMKSLSVTSWSSKFIRVSNLPQELFQRLFL